MEDVKIILSALWIATMLIYQQGDVMRLYTGDFKAGESEFGGFTMTQGFWLAMNILFSIPVVMIIVSLILENPVNRWANIIVAAFFCLFNLVGVPTYPGAYDRFLLLVSCGFNVLTVWYAWNWI
jgi:hypothetical protein